MYPMTIRWSNAGADLIFLRCLDLPERLELPERLPNSSSTVRVVIFSDCRLPCVKTAMPDKTGKIPQIPG